ncbi:MAG: hypothetical protein V2J55_04210, partial [Candidatus Competibacteraceae bacterium]|nr:hypothetical protein [Candidatus Competibacteraceae bacterium]
AADADTRPGKHETVCRQAKAEAALQQGRGERAARLRHQARKRIVGEVKWLFLSWIDTRNR